MTKISNEVIEPGWTGKCLCPACKFIVGQRSLLTCDKDDIFFVEYEYKYNYCPNCGIKLVWGFGGEENDN